MRKILIFVLVMTIAVVFAGCGDNEDDQTTLNPLNTAYAPTSSGNQQAGNNAATGATYILTTNQGKTVPSLNTTRFVPGGVSGVSSQQVSTTVDPYASMTYNTSGVIAVPSYSVANASSTTWQTIAPSSSVTTPVVPTPASTATPVTPTTKPTTTQAEPEGVYVSVGSLVIDTEGRFVVPIESDNWGGRIKSNSQRVSVYIDGVEMEGGAMLQITSSTDGDGYQSVYLNLGDYEIDPDSSTVTFVIPEGFLENKTGTKYNYEYEVNF